MKKLQFSIWLLLGLQACESDNDLSQPGSDGQAGQGGSLARFTVANDHLFIVDGSQLKTFSLQNAADPVYLSNQNVNAQVETVFPLGDSTLFIGTTTGMLIYDVTTPLSIEHLSTYQHVVACDPVVANAQYAYVTLRSDPEVNWCFRSVNQLDIIDIRNLRQPQLVTEIPMINPKGLGLYGDTLLVCDVGVKVMDVSNPIAPNLLSAFERYQPFDIIPYSSLMIFVGESGLEQYRFHRGQLQYLSTL